MLAGTLDVGSADGVALQPFLFPFVKRSVRTTQRNADLSRSHQFSPLRLRLFRHYSLSTSISQYFPILHFHFSTHNYCHSPCLKLLVLKHTVLPF